MPEISARLSVPNRVMTPATTQTRSSSSGDSSWEAISPGFLKMPEPMTEPMAKAMAAISPIERSSSTGCFFSAWSMFPRLPARGAGGFVQKGNYKEMRK